MNEWREIVKLGGAGILTESDVKDLKTQRGRVLKLMLDGHWHPAEQIIQHAGGREGLRRLRELREIPHTEIEKIKHPLSKREYLYRLKYAPGVQRTLFND